MMRERKGEERRAIVWRELDGGNEDEGKAEERKVEDEKRRDGERREENDFTDCTEEEMNGVEGEES